MTLSPIRPFQLAIAIFTQLGLTFSAIAASQSPIDFTPANTVYSSLSPLSYNYSSNATLQVYNNGSPDEDSTVRSNVGASDGSLDVLGLTYTLKQFHFHTDSEHLLNGVAFPMEIHLVHQQVGATDNNGLLVTGRWIVEGAENVALASIFSNLPTDPTGYSLSNFNLSALLPSSLESYRYSGSLTTPTYDEPVQWVFLNTPLEMSAAQIQAFRTLFPAGNARDVQALDGRTITTDVIPEPSSLGLLSIGAVFFMARSRRR